MHIQIQRLRDLKESDEGHFGAKAVNLARLLSLGLTVPAGVAVSVSLDEGLKERVVDLVLEDPRLETMLRRELGEVFFPLAVRSSSPSEDGVERSYAGQFESILNVRDRQELKGAIERCLHSAQSARARSYAGATQTAPRHFGIVLQKMIDAEYAGICFTRDPIDGSMVGVEWTSGLGDKLAAGRVSGNRVQWPRDPGRARPQGNWPVELLGCFSDLAEVARKLEVFWKQGLDLEWALAQGRLHLLQARPTTHERAQERRESLRQAEVEKLRRISGQERHLWTDSSIGDVLPDPSPLIMDSFLRATDDEGGVARAFRALGFSYRRRPMRNAIFETICGRAYINVTEYVATIRETCR